MNLTYRQRVVMTSLLALALLLLGCATTARTAHPPLNTGEEIAPPPGCVEARERGGAC